VFFVVLVFTDVCAAVQGIVRSAPQQDIMKHALVRCAYSAWFRHFRLGLLVGQHNGALVASMLEYFKEAVRISPAKAPGLFFGTARIFHLDECFLDSGHLVGFQMWAVAWSAKVTTHIDKTVSHA
jgi:hypothetical protein